MATIALYQGKINQMPGLIKAAKQSVESLKSELSSLQKKASKVDSGVCDMSEVISSVETCTKTQENRIEALENFRIKSEDFINDVVRIDGKVADTVNQNKEDFYDKYDYLKPDCEREKEGFLQKAGRWLSKAGEWCKRAWESGAITQFLCCLVEVVATVALLAAVIVTGGTLAIVLAGVGAALVLTHAAGGFEESWNKARGADNPHNFVRDSLLGGNQTVYDLLPMLGFGLMMAGAGYGGATVGGIEFFGGTWGVVEAMSSYASGLLTNFLSGTIIRGTLQKLGASENTVNNLTPLLQIALSYAASKYAARKMTNASKENTYYRTMKPEDYETLKQTGSLPASRKGETFISPTEEFSSNYDGAMVKFRMRGNFIETIKNIGVKDGSNATRQQYPNMPNVFKGWKSSNAFFKYEQGQINIGLGEGQGLDVFNSSFWGWFKIR